MGFQFASKSKQPAQRKSAPPSSKTLRSPAPAHPMLQLQRTIGNQGVLRLLESPSIQPKCACGGTCPRCRQSNLKMSQPGDTYEQEADRVADQVMRAPQSSVQRWQEGVGSRSEQAATAVTSVTNPARGNGQPLPASARSYFEPRFGHDFSQVRVHSDAAAAETAQHLRARAFTVGQHVAFGAGQYSPGTTEGRRLLAHELTHVVQQGAGAPGAGMFQAHSIHRSGEPMVQRTLTVDPTHSIPLPPGVTGPPEPLTNAVERLMGTTCPTGNFQVNRGTGAVTLNNPSFCQWAGVPFRAGVTRADLSPTPAGCGCLCDVVNHAKTTTIGFRPGGPGTGPRAVAGVSPGHGGIETDPTLDIDPRFEGQYLIGGRWVDVPFHLIFSHELCGHALPLMRGTHVRPGPAPPAGTPPHEREAVDVERAMAAEGGHPRRPEDYAGTARERP